MNFGLQNGKKLNFSKIYGENFFIFKSKSSLFTSFFIFSTISQILKTKFDVF